MSTVDDLRSRYLAVRRFTEKLCEPLTAEDCTIQSMKDTSPTRWHLAHSTWFFETFVLAAVENYKPFHPAFKYLFNSYYNAVGEQFPRPNRGLLSRPPLAEIFEYRAHVDRRMEEVLGSLDVELDAGLLRTLELGINHEEQHQELILTDIKHVLSLNPLRPVYREAPAADSLPDTEVDWISFSEGVFWIGHDGAGFAYDNESPRHRVFVEPYGLASRLVTNGEYIAFLDDGGYKRAALWLSAGWQQVCDHGWNAPLYWVREKGAWRHFTLAGLRAVDPAAPVCHVSYFEADAFARWAGARLPTEAEWELGAAAAPIEGNFVEEENFQPVPLRVASPARPAQLFGDVWEWTSSSYAAYPGYQPPEGALGEYNGKFMCNQYVLRGGSCATPARHVRATYRNFFPPEARWQFSGLRLAR